MLFVRVKSFRKKNTEVVEIKIDQLGWSACVKGMSYVVNGCIIEQKEHIQKDFNLLMLSCAFHQGFNECGVYKTDVNFCLILRSKDELLQFFPKFDLIQMSICAADRKSVSCFLFINFPTFQ